MTYPASTWSVVLPAYRIYWFDQDDHVTEADYLIADADDDVRGGRRRISKRLRPLRFGTGRVLSCEWRARSSPALLPAKSIVRSRPHSPLVSLDRAHRAGRPGSHADRRPRWRIGHADRVVTNCLRRASRPSRARRKTSSRAPRAMPIGTAANTGRSTV